MTHPHRTRRLVRLLALAALAPLAPLPARAEAPVTLKFAHWVPARHPFHADATAWAKSLEEASKGSLKVAFFPAEQLGKAKDHYDMARDGIADITWVNPGYTPGRFPIAAAGELPFLVSNATGGSTAFDEWYRPHAAREMKDVKVCLAHLHDPGTLHTKKPVALPSDVKGMKIRPAHATMARFVSELGGSSVQVAAPEAGDAIEKGVADALTFPWNSVLLFKIDRAVKHHIDAPMYVTTFVWAMNKDRYKGLSAAQKAVVDDHCSSKWAARAVAGWVKWEQEGREALKKAADHKLRPLSGSELADWRKAAAPLQAAWAKDVRKTGADPQKVFADLKASLKKHGAAY